jgi:hypothetical protein
MALDDDETRAFFASADAAVARLHAEERKAAQLEDAALSKPPPPPSPAQIARRQQLRKVVGGVLGVAIALAAMMLLRVAMAPKESDLARLEVPPMPRIAAPITSIEGVKVTPDATNPPAEAPGSVAPVASDAASAAASASAAPTDSAAPADSAAPPLSASAAPADSVAPAASAAPPASASASASAAAPSGASPEEVKALTRKALSLLEQGSYKGAIEKASASVAADPTDANAYLYWGTALMNMGKTKEAKEVFARCVSEATRGPKNECRQFR